MSIIQLLKSTLPNSDGFELLELCFWEYIVVNPNEKLFNFVDTLYEHK